MSQEPTPASPEANDTRHFLLSKARSDTAPQRAFFLDSDETADALRRTYPHLLRGKSLTIRALSALEAVAEFAAAVVQIDADPAKEGALDPDTEAGPREAVAGILEALCRSAAGLWGVLDATAFGCYLPGVRPPEMLERAAEIQKKAAGAGRTVTIGLASYPTLDYPKDKILDNARKALDHAKFFGPDSLVAFDAISLNISGDRLYDEGAYQAAIEEYETALRLDPLNANLHNSLGVCHGVTGDFLSALARFKEALALDAAETLAHYNAGLVCLLRGERDQARAHLLEADRRPHPLFEVRLQLGRLFLEAGEPDKGRAYLESAAALRPRSSAVHSLLGECYAALDLRDEAMAVYKKSLRLNANDAAALSGLGWLYHAMDKNADIARLFCRHSVAIAPRNGLFHHRLGCLYLKENRLTEARDAFRTAVDLGCDSAAHLAEVQSRLLDKAS